MLTKNIGVEATPAGGWNAPRGAPVRDRQKKSAPAVSLGAVAAGVEMRRTRGLLVQPESAVRNSG
jgi:hypothetical protein